MSLAPAAGVVFPLSVPVVIVGAGACGLVAALSLGDAGRDVLVVERDGVPTGSTAMSSGMVPACGTRMQRDKGIDDDPARMAADIQCKAHGQADQRIVDAVCRASGPTVDWLADAHGVPFQLTACCACTRRSRPRVARSWARCSRPPSTRASTS